MKYKITMCFEFDDTKPLSQQNNSIIGGIINSACPLVLGFPHPGCHYRYCIDCWKTAFEMVCDKRGNMNADEPIHVRRLD